MTGITHIKYVNYIRANRNIFGRLWCNARSRRATVKPDPRPHHLPRRNYPASSHYQGSRLETQSPTCRRIRGLCSKLSPSLHWEHRIMIPYTVKVEQADVRLCQLAPICFQPLCNRFYLASHLPVFASPKLVKRANLYAVCFGHGSIRSLHGFMVFVNDDLPELGMQLEPATS